MFETSQEEQNSGSGRIVGGVIAVVAVLLVIVYFAFLRGPASTTTGSPATNSSATGAAGAGEKPDPMKDLSIVKQDLGRDQTQTMAMLNIQVANRSKTSGYKNIKYASNYYNASDALIYHNEGTLSSPLDPGDQQSFNVNDGLYPIGVTRYTVEIKGADPVQQ